MKVSLLLLLAAIVLEPPFAYANEATTMDMEENQNLRGRSLARWWRRGRKPTKNNRCQSSQDCAESHYCSSGNRCLPDGKCSNLSDCENPQNSYGVIECFGELQCMSDGTCGRICGTDVDDPDQCKSDDDCGEGNYCAGGQCRAHGECGSDVDCMNPANPFAAIDCVGYVECDIDAGVCNKVCSENPCPNGQSQPRCAQEPCAALAQTCDDSFVSCVNDYCGGCNAIAFDAAGLQVCNRQSDQEGTTSPQPASKPSLPSCKSNSDCNAEDSYCSKGQCRKFGDCKNDADCFNPANIYSTIFCEGPIQCQQGRCGRECSGSPCPDGEDFAECIVSPCSVVEASCDANIVSCTDYYCGGCNTFAFNAAGYQVCKQN